jgi:hypothetical protein
MDPQAFFDAVTLRQDPDYFTPPPYVPDRNSRASTNPADARAYKRAYDVSKGKTCAECGTPITNGATWCLKHRPTRKKVG